ncbi:hypothetical protein F511_26820 [Dorcoceras hygrometricum]|uniref:DUF4228 domain-containing protein n=1 Tax=Dorcoceras hygrometricum TaxID=472368 RepID=A0A2Z7BNZ7_9LAMI|nr:hypothetical protein F511_26820 [Dorcoceras hygrometricum]
MGNCQATDTVTLVIQHPNGKENRLFKPIVATEIMKINPGHYVALLLTTTYYPSASAAAVGNKDSVKKNNVPLRVTRIKLLRPTDTLALGHVYRLVTTEEVTKGLGAKKLAKWKQQQQSVKGNTDFDGAVGRNDVEMTKQVNNGGHSSRNNKAPAVYVSSKSKAWQPSLSSISEAGN